ncbi:MAG: enoyl-CoA hydratase-related protein [Chloroflexota bacterium]
MSDQADVLVQRRGAIATLVLHHPRRRNAMTVAMWDRLGVVARELNDDSSVAVIILRGSGVDAFSAGADISEFDEQRSTPEKALAYSHRVHHALEGLVNASKPTIAMVSGYCVGGGCELAIAMDMRIVADGATFGIPAARLGISIAFDDIKRLVDLVGPAYASEILFTGRRLSAERALQIGLVNQVVAAEDLERLTYEIAEEIAGSAPTSVAWSKRAIKLILRDPGLTTAPDRDAQAAQAFGTDDFREGVRAFLEKRPPKFLGT